MIGRIHGKLIANTPPRLLIDCHGVGYEVDVPMSTLYQMPSIGQEVTLLTHFVVREDAQQLFGFASEAEREAFRSLIKISGIGARTALSLLSGMSVEDLAQAVALQESARLTKVPGIGKKTAERLLLELKGKIAPALGGANHHTHTDSQTEIISALVALGYSEKEAQAATRQLASDTSVSDGIRAALKNLAKA
jgi:Holliday junction DNA helicase RuvA